MNWKTLAAAVLGLGLIGATGCDSAAPTKAKKDAEGAHDDHGPGPHGGLILELGKYHGEFKPDHAKKEVTVWILGGDVITPARIKADKVRLVVTNTTPKIEMDLLPADKDANGTASVFVGKNDGFGVEMEYKGTVAVTIDGKPYHDDFEEKPEKKK